MCRDTSEAFLTVLLSRYSQIGPLRCIVTDGCQVVRLVGAISLTICKKGEGYRLHPFLVSEPHDAHFEGDSVWGGADE